MLALEPREFREQRRLAIFWGITFIVTLPVIIVLGLMMRGNQGEILSLAPNTFYSIMTFHGLAAIGLLFTLSFMGLWYLISTRYVKLNVTLGYFVYFTLWISILGLGFATLIEKWAPGWYLLYPMPFVNATWTNVTNGIAIVSLILMGVIWPIGFLHILYKITKAYGGLKNVLGWQYFKKDGPEEELPPIIMITAISLIPGFFAIISGATFLIMYLLQVFEPSLEFDPLLIKNLIMFFGHTIANITMYCAVGWIYELLPEFTKRKWKLNKVLVISWNVTFFAIVFAYAHHLYYDFVQPLPWQFIGQLLSYTSPIPATAITMFGILGQVYHTKTKWTIVPLTFFIGAAGWAVGGFAAVVDSTINLNKVLHNTLWVPAHFHTYILMGVVLFIFGYLFYLFSNEGDYAGGKIAKVGFWTYVAGGSGFLLMFYLSGMYSVPRRYNVYSAIQVGGVHETGVANASFAYYSVIVLLVGLALIYFALIKKLLKLKKTEV